jgi:hypothetical protein
MPRTHLIESFLYDELPPAGRRNALSNLAQEQLRSGALRRDTRQHLDQHVARERIPGHYVYLGDGKSEITINLKALLACLNERGNDNGLPLTTAELHAAAPVLCLIAERGGSIERLAWKYRSDGRSIRTQESPRKNSTFTSRAALAALIKANEYSRAVMISTLSTPLEERTRHELEALEVLVKRLWPTIKATALVAAQHHERLVGEDALRPTLTKKRYLKNGMTAPNWVLSAPEATP